MVTEKPLLSVKDLSVTFSQYTRGLKRRELTVITDLNLEIAPGRIMAVVGSSGSGKSLLAHAILGLLPANAAVSGSICYDGDVLTPKHQAKLRGKEMVLVPQSVNFLDPLMQVGKQVRLGTKDKKVTKQREIFDRYQLKEESETLYPFQLSGGMARRVLISASMISDARLIIADEPTPGLHHSVVKETLGHLRELADQGKAVMLITHDIDSALTVADDIAVFYAGTTVEVTPAADFGSSEKLRHPYTKALWHALPSHGFKPIPGFQPPPGDLPSGCLFAPRCNMATPECTAGRPAISTIRGGKVRCIHAT